MSTEHLFFNGIDGATGDYLTPSLTPQQVSQIALGERPLPPLLLDELKYKTRSGLSFVTEEGVDPKKLDEAGWGIIFPHGIDPAIRDALKQLIDHRRQEATAKYERRFRICTYRPGESKLEFLEREAGGATTGPVNPDQLPYYLLIVGDPEAVPYSFQYQLDVQYAVGRIYFDQPEQYAQYAQSVVEAEKKQLTLPRRASFFGVSNPDDPATQLSATSLVQPLAESTLSDKPDWSIDTILGETATKGRLGELLGGAATPALLFTASHGMGFPNGDSRQIPHQGALLCQDWPGPREYGKRPIPQDYYLAADDIGRDAKLWGLLAFHFACYGAGTPRVDDFAHLSAAPRQTIAPQAFVAALPQRLLSHPQGGALAVVGHVERAWGYSFTWNDPRPQLGIFKSTLKRLMEGHPIGSAFEYFNQRYAELSSELSRELGNAKYAESHEINHFLISQLWTANNDARGYSIIGDPAVRLMVGSSSAPLLQRPTTSTVVVSSVGSSHQSATDITAAIQASTDVPVTEPVDFGVRDMLSGSSAALKQAQERLADSLKQFCDKLGTTLTAAVSNASSLEVSTYVSDDLTQITYDATTRQFTGAKLRAFTRMELDGDTQVCVPEEDGELDEMLWKIHTDTLQQAQSQRTELIKAVASAATGLLQSMQGL